MEDTITYRDIAIRAIVLACLITALYMAQVTLVRAQNEWELFIGFFSAFCVSFAGCGWYDLFIYNADGQ